MTDTVIVTLVGNDDVGIIAKVCNYFASNGMNILDITQTTLRKGEIISMNMVVCSKGKDIEKIKKGLNEVSKDTGCSINIIPNEIKTNVKNKEISKTIITLSGEDGVGIIGKVCSVLSEKKINILDISQTTTKNKIDMMMVVDTSKYKGSFKELIDTLSDVGKTLNCTIKTQQEEIFDMMHRI